MSKIKYNDTHHINQVCKRLEDDLKDKRDELADAVEQLAPKGKLIQVKRGAGVWEVESDGACRGHYYEGCFRGKTRTGKYHCFHYTTIIV